MFATEADQAKSRTSHKVEAFGAGDVVVGMAVVEHSCLMPCSTNRFEASSMPIATPAVKIPTAAALAIGRPLCFEKSACGLSRHDAENLSSELVATHTLPGMISYVGSLSLQIGGTCGIILANGSASVSGRSRGLGK